ncbi:MAG: hypothetical protein V1733_05800 [bacterium]
MCEGKNDHNNSDGLVVHGTAGVLKLSLSISYSAMQNVIYYENIDQFNRIYAQLNLGL